MKPNTQPAYSSFSEELKTTFTEACLLSRDKEVAPEHLLIAMLRNGTIVDAMLEKKLTQWLIEQPFGNMPTDKEQMLNQIQIWTNRAEMARRQGITDLEAQALQKAEQCRCKLQDTE